MNQVSPFLRRAVDGYTHWCPGCEGPHGIPDTWKFDGDLEKPTFTPSVNISGVIQDDAGAEELVYRCHYTLTSGQLTFQPDCTHALKGQTVPLPALPPHMMDEVA